MAAGVIGLMLLGLLVLYAGVGGLRGHGSDVYKQQNGLATKQFKSVVVEGEMRQLFSKLALDYDVPIGVELDYGSPDLSSYRLELVNGSLPELLDQFVRQNGKYTWFIENGVVNIFPRGERRDPFLAEMLLVRIKALAIKKGSSSEVVQELLCTSPELKVLMDANGVQPAGSDLTGFYIPQLGREFSLQTSDLTTKEILNRIVKNSPVARIWIVSREHPAGTLRVTVNSRQEINIPKN